MRRLGSVMAGGLLALVVASCGESKVVAGSSEGKLSPELVELGVVQLGSQGSAFVEVRNTGPGSIRFAVEGATPFFSVQPMEGRLGPYGVRVLEVRFAPGEEGIFGASWTLRFAGGRSAVELHATGEGRLSNVGAPDVVDFGAVRVGQRETRDLQLRNLVEEPLQVRIGTSGGDQSNFGWEEELVSLRPGGTKTIALDFLPKGSTGQRELYLSLDCGGCPTRYVRLVGQAVVPELEATPRSLEFGFVPAGTTKEVSAIVRNVGPVASGPVRIGWDSSSHSTFEVIQPRFARELQPGEEMEVIIAFLSSQTQGERRGTLEFFSEEEKLPLKLPVRAQGGAPALSTSKKAVDFVIPLGWERNPKDPYVWEAIVEVHNAGAPLTLDVQHALKGEGVGAYEVLPLDGVRLVGEERLRYLVRFDPIWEEMNPAVLELSAVGAAPATVSLFGWGNVPVAACGQTIRTSPNQRVFLQGKDESRLGDGSCAWGVAGAPRGSNAMPVSQRDPCVATFVPDVVGVFDMELAVTDVVGNVDTCIASLIASPAHELWIEAHWDRVSDVDLHLFNLDLGDPNERADWSSEANCFYHNCLPSLLPLPWGTSVFHVPSLERDDTTGTGPEHISVPRLAEGGRFAVGLHWYQRYNADQTHATVNVFCKGMPVEEVEVLLDEQKLFYRIGELTVTAEGCEYTRSLLRWDGF